MSHHHHHNHHDHQERPAGRRTERTSDVLVVGGSAAGLAAALQLGRQRRSVIVVDAGRPRNAPADHLHGYLGSDGLPPSELLAAGRRDVRRYGGEVLDGRVVEVARGEDGRFQATLTGGHSITARQVLVATGLVDQLPDIDGLARHWGRGVIHCPFCHGYEVRDRRIVQIITHPMGLHPSSLFRQLTDRLTIVVHGDVALDPTALEPFPAAGVDVVRSTVAGIVTGADGGVAGVDLADGRRLDADAVVVGPRFRVPVEPFRALGLQVVPHPSGLGEVIETDETGATPVPGVWAAGNAADPSQQLLQAAAAGGRVGAMISFALADEDLRAAARPNPAQVDWDRRYCGDRLWSGNPNGALVAELDGLAPGRALDVGAGEGGDAIWLAEQGWTVTANDISAAALDRMEAAAAERGLEIGRLHGDANGPTIFGDRRFDLVTAHYASIPRTADGRAVANLVGAVAPGGTLLVVSHDLEPMRQPIDTATASRAFDPDAYVRVEDVRAAVAHDPAWTVEVDEKRARPAGAASASHHVDDLVFRARWEPADRDR